MSLNGNTNKNINEHCVILEEEVRVKQINNEFNNHSNCNNFKNKTNKIEHEEEQHEDSKHEFSIREIKNDYSINISNNNSENNNQTEENILICSLPRNQNDEISHIHNDHDKHHHHGNQCDHKGEELLERISISNSTSSNLTKTSSDDSKKYKHLTNDKLTLDYFLTSCKKLIKTNEEFFYLVIFLGIWLGLALFEFIYGISQAKVHIISDSFFNYFKTFSYLISGISILLTRVSIFNKVFLKNRIELIAALSNCVFLIIVSMYMFLLALHMITEPDDHDHDSSTSHSNSPINQEEQDTISFFKNFFILKVIIDVVGVLVFSDYILHPSIQIKLFLWKKNRSWKDLKDLTIENLKECRNLIKIWNNHYENMNALTVNIISDLFSSILFLLCFYLSKDRHFEGAYFFISIVNLVLLIGLVSPLMKSTIKILMQGRSELYECFYNKLHQEVSYFEGCQAVKEMKFWMTAQNDIKCNYYFFNK